MDPKILKFLSNALTIILLLALIVAVYMWIKRPYTDETLIATGNLFVTGIGKLLTL